MPFLFQRIESMTPTEHQDRAHCRKELEDHAWALGMGRDQTVPELINILLDEYCGDPS